VKSNQYQIYENNLEFLRYGSYYTENPRVAGSIPALATKFKNSQRSIS
jgi:hypothetical protein